MTLRLPLLLAALGSAAACSRGLEVGELRPPAQLSAQSFANDAIEVHWEPVPGVREYRVYSAVAASVSSENYRELDGVRRETAVPSIYFYGKQPGSVESLVVTSVVGNRESKDSAVLSLLPQYIDLLPAVADQVLDPGNDPGWFGAALAAGDVNCDGTDDLLVGAPEATSGQNGNSYLHLGSRDGVSQSVDRLHGASFGFGTAVAVGDLNGDGCAETLVGSPEFNNAHGEAFVYNGELTNFGNQVWNETADDNDDRFGETMAVIGDINGDAFADFAVSQPGSGSGDELQIFRGAAGNPSTVPINRPAGGQPFPIELSALGDITGDGRAEFVIGTRGYDLGGSDDLGRIEVVTYPASATFSDLLDVHGAADEQLGAGIAVGDLDGDGELDVLAGAPGANAGSGAIDVFRFSVDSGGFPQAASYRFLPDDPQGALGSALAAAGDVDGDGNDDVFAAAPDEDAFAGAVHLFVGFVGPDAILDNASVTGTTPGEGFGTAITAGDFNGDGVRDLAVGVPFRNTNAGAVEIFFTRVGTSPLPDAGDILHATTGEALSPAGAWFSDRAANRHWQCTWDPGDGSVATVLDDCTPQTAGNYSHVWTTPGTYPLTLRVTRLPDGFFGEAATTVIVE